MKSIKPLAVAASLQLGLSALQAQITYTPQPLPSVTVQGTAPIPQADSSATTVVSGDEVQPGEVTSVRDLSAQEPNLTVFDGNNDRTPKFSVRGLRENNFGVGEPVVGMYVDDVPYFDLNSRGASLYDVQSIQFARGEQGTLYGAGGVGGVMSITTKQPGNDWHGSGTVGYGDYDAQNYQVGAGGALIPNQLYLSLDGLYGLRHGYVYNAFNGSRPDTQNTLGGRTELRWTPSQPWTIALTATGERFHDGFISTYRPGPLGAPYPVLPPDPSPFVVDRNLNGYNDTADDSQALKISYDAGPAIVSSVTTHRDWKENLLQDYDFSAGPFVEGYTQPRVEQWGEELRVKSPDSAEGCKWLAGFYYLDNDLKSDSDSTGSPASVTDADGQTYALFGQGTYTAFQKLDLTAGLRATWDDRAIHGLVVSPLNTPLRVNNSADFSAVQPKFALAWHFTPQDEVYASAAEGYQSGGFNSFINNNSYNPARSWQYELGLKSSCDDNKYTTHAALFYTDTEGYQVVRISPVDPLVSDLLNARRAVTYGAELELAARPVSDLELGASAGYTCATYENFLDNSAAPLPAVQLAGKPISFVPEFTANLSATYHLPWHTYVRGEVIGVGRYHLDDSGGAGAPAKGPTVQDSYELVNAQVGYETKNFGIYLYARNVFDRHYYNNALNLGPGSGTSSLILQPGDPETCGLAATVRF